MHFVERHLTRHFLFHAPHQWFFALLASPIHLAELHYKRRYHLNYTHAKTLFAFDLLLLLGACILITATVFWYIYDPTVTSRVALSLSASTHDERTPPNKIRSGEHVTYTVFYKNNSDTMLRDVMLGIQFPSGFLYETGAPVELFTSSTRTFSLPTLPPGASGEVSASGFFYGIPEKNMRVTAILSYRQEGRAEREQRVAAIITILRGSVLETSLNAPEAIVDQGRTTVGIRLTNADHHPIANILIPLSQDSLFRIVSIEPQSGSTTASGWRIASLAPGESVSAHMSIESRISVNAKTAVFRLTPSSVINGIPIPHATATRAFTVLHPRVELTSAWEGQPSFLRPGETSAVVLSLKNSGKEQLNNITVRIAAVEMPIGKDIVVTSQNNAALASLAAGEIKTIRIPISIARHVMYSGNNLVMRLSAAISTVIGRRKESIYETTAEIAPIPIGTDLSINTDARYYTDDGDQLGRGPLPPTVGKETKYWVSIRTENGTSDVERATTEATLAPGIGWTGKYSMSMGKNPLFRVENRTVKWEIPTIPAHSAALLNMELSFTPAEEHRGVVPLLMESVRVTGTDAFTGAVISAGAGALDASLTSDAIGHAKGTKVR